MTTKSAENTIRVNGEARPLPSAATVQALLEELALADRRLAVEVNEDVVPRSEYATTPLRAGDQIEIIRAIGGG